MPRIKHIDYGFTIEAKGTTRPLYQQVHGCAYVEVAEANLSHLYQNPPLADGAITYEPNLKLSVFTADCLPLLFFTDDPKGPIATVHCGWRGALQSIASSIEDLWLDYLGQINVILGPCIGPCCFEVKEDLIQQFQSLRQPIESYLIQREGKVFFNLSQFVIHEQLKFIDNNRIFTQDQRCTFCSNPSLPSYRKNKSTDPRIRGWIIKNT